MIRCLLALLLAVPAMARTIEYERPPLTDYQFDAYWDPARHVLVEGATKTGKGHAGMAWLFEQAAVVAKHTNYWWAAPVYPQSAITYRRLKDAIPAHLRKPNDSDMSLTLPNKRIIWFKSCEKPDNLFGEDVGAAVIDEASRVRAESWHAIRTTLTSTRGPIRSVGNVKGKKNWFYQLCRKAEAGEQDMAYHRFVSAQAVAAGILEQAEIEGARRDLPEAVFRELYLAEASDDGGNPFGIEAIRARIINGLAAGPAEAYGGDLAKSQDWTVLTGLNKDGGVCNFSRWQGPWGETMDRLEREAKAPCLLDSTGVGDPIVEGLQRKYPGRFDGYKFTQESKQKLMEGLAVAIQRGEISYPDGPIVSELESFEYNYTRTGVHYSAPEAMHDDCVCSLALAVAKLKGGTARWRPV